MSRIISIINQKGGVGKTTTTFNMAYLLSRDHRKILVIDLDPQANLTMCCGYPYPDDLSATVVDLMMMDKQEIAGGKYCYVQETDLGFDLIPGCIALAGLEQWLINRKDREQVLAGALSGIEGEYDYILIDCMPSLGMLTINALVASSEIVITTSAEYMSAKGLEMLLNTVSRVRKRMNKNLKISGILLTMSNMRTNHSKQTLETIKDAYGAYIKVFNTVIPRSIKVAEANEKEQPIVLFRPKNNVSEAYISFVEEFVNE